MTTDRKAAAAAIDAFLRALGLDSPDTSGTGDRVAQMFADDLCAGHAVDTRKLLKDAAMAATNGGIVIVRDVPVTTTCPHHLIPSIGTATVAFEASGHLVGLGTIAALVGAHARRLTLQETIGAAIVDDLHGALAPAWVACRLVLVHGCMVARGERATGTSVETIAKRGPADVGLLR